MVVEEEEEEVGGEEEEEEVAVVVPMYLVPLSRYDLSFLQVNAVLSSAKVVPKSRKSEMLQEQIYRFIFTFCVNQK